MPAITTQNIKDDARVLFDINKDEKEAKLDLFMRQTVVDIVRNSSGMLSNKLSTVTVANGEITFPDDFEVVYAMFFNSQEIMPVDVLTKIKWQQQNAMGAPYCYISVDDSANIKAEITNVGNGSNVTIAYKRRTDDITKIPEVYRYMVMNGLMWRYEKYELRREYDIYKDTYNEYKDFLEDLAIRTSGQENWTQKFNYLNEWEAILSRI